MIMKNGHSKKCDCGIEPCMSHRYKGRYRCSKCISIMCGTDEKQPIKHHDMRADLVTRLLRIEGRRELQCKPSPKSGYLIYDKDGYYYTVRVYGRYEFLPYGFEGEFLWGDRFGDVMKCILRHNEPIACDIYEFLSTVVASGNELKIPPHKN